MNWPNLHAPWRIDYIKRSDDPAEPACFLCHAHESPPADDPANLVLLRDPAGLILMNRYPYTNGHLMVAPIAHRGDLLDLTPADRAALMELTARAHQLIRDTLNPQGVNIGINVGKAAGAGVPGHLHIHLVPRWAGDTNFMHVFAHVRVNPQAVEDLYNDFRSRITS